MSNVNIETIMQIELPEHCVMLVFNDDASAVIFHDWWHHNKNLFEEYLTNQDREL